MKVHLITNLFQPDELAGAALYTDLALYLAERGHDVRVTTTFSYYPAWKVKPEDRGVRSRDESFRDIVVRRLWMYVPTTPSGRKRIVSDFSFFWSLVKGAQFADWTPDVVLTASPMLSQCLAQRFLYPKGKIPRVIVVQDFVIDAALELKILTAPGIKGLLLWLERWSFESAATLITISPAMLEKLQTKLRQSRRTVLLPNWIHKSLDDAINSAPNLGQRKANVLFYSGNLGVKQGLPDVVSSFKRCNTGWKLKIHGGGAEADKLRALVNNQSFVEIGNVLEEADYVRELHAATACLITQKPDIGANFLPSKLLPALASGTPVLAVCDSDTPLGLEVKAGAFGEVVPPGDDTKLKETLQRWSENPALLEKMSQNALTYGARYKRTSILSKYELELERLVLSKP